MRTLGIIAEYNPFHNGHQIHLNMSQKNAQSTASVCIMSGNFTQRGELALFDKWTRAKMAVYGGIDLVIELPVVFAVRSAEAFASAAIRLLNSLEIIDTVAFGAETPDYLLLNKIATSLMDENTIKSFQRHMKSGQSYPTALATAINNILDISPTLLSEPNNILAIEYLKAINQYDCQLSPLIIPRISSHHNNPMIIGNISSATAIRKILYHHPQNISAIKDCVPNSTYEQIEEADKLLFRRSLNNLSVFLLAKLRNSTLANLQSIPGISEGLEHKLFNIINRSTSYDDLIQNLKSKRYPTSRLQRILIHYLLNTNKEVIKTFDEAGPLYARVLAFNQKGRLLIKNLKQTSSLPIINKVSNYITSKDKNKPNLSMLQQMLLFDIYATDLFFLSINDSKYHIGGLDFLHSPIYIDK